MKPKQQHYQHCTHFSLNLTTIRFNNNAITIEWRCYDEKVGECKRGLYVIDEEGIIYWSYLSPIGINPGADGILDALEEMSLSK